MKKNMSVYNFLVRWIPMFIAIIVMPQVIGSFFVEPYGEFVFKNNDKDSIVLKDVIWTHCADNKDMNETIKSGEEYLISWGPVLFAKNCALHKISFDLIHGKDAVHYFYEFNDETVDKYGKITCEFDSSKNEVLLCRSKNSYYLSSTVIEPNKFEIQK